MKFNRILFFLFFFNVVLMMLSLISQDIDLCMYSSAFADVFGISLVVRTWNKPNQIF
jgi:hypothetical protein